MHQLLIVDDQPDLVDDLAEMLPWKSVGIGNVHKAYSAPEALEIVMTQPIDVIISDIRMPGMSGLDLVERIRASWKQIRCILLSGYDDFEYAKRALQHKATDYLLKPADDKELLDAVARAIQDIEEQWKDVSSLRNALHSVKQNLPILRDHLLMSLLEGRHEEDFGEKLGLLEIPFAETTPICMMLLRLEDHFDHYGKSDISLMEFAVTNIAEEIFGDDLHLWHTRDLHGYLVYMIQAKRRRADLELDVREQIEMKASLLQHNVKLYLKGTVSILISPWGKLPQEIRPLYEQAVASFRQHIGSQREYLLSIGEAPEETPARAANSLTHLYDPPLLIHLLESGQWSSLDTKLEAIYTELEHKWGNSHEHILETYFTIVSSLSSSIHKNKRWMSDIMEEDDFQKLIGGPQFHTIHQLKEWTMRVVTRYKGVMESESKDSRSNLVRQVQDYVQQHLGEASLQSIAAHVYLNPSYLSKIYKLETGEGISDLLLRLKMEQATVQLRNSHEKIYEIATGLGYVKTSYFIKVFKEKFGMTPQEYRDRLS